MPQISSLLPAPLYCDAPTRARGHLVVHCSVWHLFFRHPSFFTRVLAQFGGQGAEWLQRWMGLLRCLSQLVNTLVPTPCFLAFLQKTVLELFWPGLHWVSAGVLSLHLKEGGQGLFCLRTQIHFFCFHALHRFPYGAGNLAWSTLTHAFLHHL